jgi:hypothetical protein
VFDKSDYQSEPRLSSHLLLTVQIVLDSYINGFATSGRTIVVHTATSKQHTVQKTLLGNSSVIHVSPATREHAVIEETVSPRLQLGEGRREKLVAETEDSSGTSAIEIRYQATADRLTGP